MGWFRVGSAQVTTTVLVTALAALGALVAALVPPVAAGGVMVVDAVLAGQLWRLLTWPFVEPFALWTVITLLLFWYFGKLLEDELGHRRMATFLAGLWAIVTASHCFAGLVLPGTSYLMGLRDLELILILLFIAESPTRPFFFRIPAWVIGVVILLLQLLPLVTDGNLGAILGLVLALLGGALWARSNGLLRGVSWLPARRRRPARRRPARPSRQQRRAHSDAERLDALLDKINAQGMDALSKRERAELTKLSERRRR